MENSNFGSALFGLKHFLAFQKASRNLAMSFLVTQKSRRTLATGFREFPKVCCNLVTSFRESMKGCCNLQEAFGKNFQCSLFKQKNRQKTAGLYVILFQIMSYPVYHITQIKWFGYKFISSCIEC